MTVPWKVVKQGTQHCVVKESDGKVVACHPTRAKALAQLRALYASEAGTLKQAHDGPSRKER